MAYANTVTRVTISGTCFGGAEHWSTGFFMGNVGADVLPPTDLGAAAVGAAWETFFESFPASISSSYLTTGVKLATLNTDGSTKAGEVSYFYPSVPFAGGGGGVAFPPQVSLVASLRSDTPRGLASKGRMYLPGVNVGVGNGGKLAGSTVSALCDVLADFFTAVNGSIDATGSVILASEGSKPPLVAPGISRMVTQVRVGDVYDTQRRRRNELVETYVSQPVLP